MFIVKRYLLFTILFSLFVSNNYCQDLSQYFSKHVPQNYLKDENSTKQLNVNLSMYASVNPNLIYFYLKYLEQHDTKHIYNLDSNYYNILSSNYAFHSNKRNELIDKEIKITKDRPLDRFKKRELIILLNNLKLSFQNNRSSVIILPVDSNKMAYYSYLYFSEKRNIEYSPEINYDSLNQISIKEKIIDFDNVISDASKDREFKKVYTKAFLNKYLFLLSSGYIEKYSNNQRLQLSEIAEVIMDDPEPDRQGSGLYIVANWNNVEYEAVNHTLFKDNYLPFSEYEIKKSFKATALASFGLDYKLSLKQNKQIFSALDINLFYTLFEGAKDDSKYQIIENTSLYEKPSDWKKGDPIIKVYEYRGFTEISNINSYKLSEFNLQLSTPIHYFYDNLNIALGVGFSYFIYKYYYTIDKQPSIVYHIDPSKVNNDPVEIETKDSKLSFYPFITINYDLFDKLNFYLDAKLGSDLFKFYAGIKFKLIRL
ncbi:MAG: hypothetical protein Q8933_17835 [Bacteroidota bacterium]|nr:hypothetical protein [Bacteroidota bacterium]